MLVLHALEKRFGQALQELVERPGSPEAVRDVGVAAVENAQLLNRGHKRPVEPLNC
jgi:hypothetical protein